MDSAQAPPVHTARPSKAGGEAPDQPGQRPQQQQANQQQRASQEPLASGPTLSYPLPLNLDLAHLHVIITGGTSGIGLEAAKVGLGCAQAAGDKQRRCASAAAARPFRQRQRC